MIQSLGRFLKRLHNDTSGKLSVEMILLLALIALPIIIVLMLFKKTIMDWFNEQKGGLVDPGAPPTQ